MGVTVQYNGEPFDPEETMNDLSYTMLKNAVTDLRHTTISEDGFTNRIECRIRE